MLFIPVLRLNWQRYYYGDSHKHCKPHLFLKAKVGEESYWKLLVMHISYFQFSPIIKHGVSQYSQTEKKVPLTVSKIKVHGIFRDTICKYCNTTQSKEFVSPLSKSFLSYHEVPVITPALSHPREVPISTVTLTLQLRPQQGISKRMLPVWIL